MRFLQPLMLLGLLAALLPIVIHLMNRRRAQRVDFPALRWLLESEKRIARSLKVRQWLLLAARVLLLLLIPLAMAQPYTLCGEGGGSTVDERLPASVAIVIDDSASMSLQRSGETLWSTALDEARSRVRGLRSWDQAVIIFAREEPEMPIDDWSSDTRALQALLDDAAPRFGRSDLPNALLRARSFQLDSQQPAKRTIVITDGDREAWASSVREEMLDGLGDLAVVELGERWTRENISIAELRSEETADGEGFYELRAQLRSEGHSEPREVAVSLEVNGERVAGTSVVVPPQGSVEARFSHRFEGSGVQRVVVRLDEEGGGLQHDNERAMALYLSRAVRVMIVNGAADALEYNDELYYFERALTVAIEGVRPIDVQSVAPENLASAEIDGFDVVVLANVAALATSEVERLSAFVQAGGGLWITAGDNVDPERYNSIFAELLPRPVREVTRLSEPDDPDVNIKATRLSNFDTQNPIFRVFTQQGGQSLQSARVLSYLLLQPQPGDTSRIIASYADGGPAILERELGDGRVVMWTTTIDLDWTDLPIRTAYLPLVQRTVEYLAQRASSGRDETEVGAPIQLDVEGLRAEQLSIQAPDAQRFVRDVEGDRVRFSPPQVGVYEVALRGTGGERAAPALSFAANPVLLEGFEAITDEALDGWVAAARGEGLRASERADIEENRRRTWPALLFVALTLFYLESLLALRRRLWRRLARFGREGRGLDPF